MSKQVADYTLLEQIGEGAFGRTFRGKHTALDLPVCLKQGKSDDPELMALFKREAALLWGLGHPSLACVQNYIEHPDFGQFMVMSYIEGEGLDKYIARKGPITDEHVMWILQRLLDALSYIHHHGIIHCDVKPENVMLQLEAHNAVLIDFGISAHAPKSSTLAIGGTRGYMPPEFDNGFAPVPASDFYSLAKLGIFLAGGNPDTGTCPDDMCDGLRALLEEMIIFDAVSRREKLGDDARTISERIAVIRKKEFNRTESVELIEHR